MKGKKHHADESNQTVILNTALYTKGFLGKAQLYLYETLSRCGKMKGVKIIHVNGRDYKGLTPEEKQLLAKADKLIVMEHCEQGRKYLEDNKGNRMTANKLLEYILHTNDDLEHVSITACESMDFSHFLAEKMRFELTTALQNEEKDEKDYLVLKKDKIKITSRKFIVIPNPIDGKLYNLDTRNGVQIYTKGEAYKKQHKFVNMETHYGLHHSFVKNKNKKNVKTSKTSLFASTLFSQLFNKTEKHEHKTEKTHKKTRTLK